MVVFIIVKAMVMIVFSLKSKDVAVLNSIHSTLKLGHISRPSDGYYTYAVSARPEIMILFQIFNGRLLLNKTNHRFVEQWASKINSAYGVNLFYAGPGLFKGFATLAGFTDSDGSFGISVSHVNSITITWSFEKSFEKPFLDYMCSTLGVGRGKYPSKGDFSNDAWRFKVDSISDSIILYDYFSKFPLFTNKASIRNIHWKQVLNWQLQGPSVVRANLHRIREFQRINALLTVYKRVSTNQCFINLRYNG